MAQKLATTGTTCTKMNTDPKPSTLAYTIPKPIKRLQKNPLHLEARYSIPPDRQIGTTTAIAFETIAKAIKNPYTWILILDHYGTAEADRHLQMVISRVCTSLELKQIYFKMVNSKFFVAFGDPK